MCEELTSIQKLYLEHVPQSVVKLLRNCGYKGKYPKLGDVMSWLEEKYKVFIWVKLADKEKETWYAKMDSTHPKVKDFKLPFTTEPLPYAQAVIEAIKKVEVFHQLIDLDDYGYADA